MCFASYIRTLVLSLVYFQCYLSIRAIIITSLSNAFSWINAFSVISNLARPA